MKSKHAVWAGLARPALTALALNLLTTAQAAGPGPNDWAGGNRLLSLTITAPESLPPGGLLDESGWSLGFRLEARNWIGYQEVQERFEATPMGGTGENFEVLILTDPDDCLDLSHTGTVRGALNDACPGGPDESFVRFAIDGAEGPDASDIGCAPSFRSRLTDTLFADLQSQGGPIPFVEANKSFLPTGMSLGPFTEDQLVFADCYGYGGNDDLPGMVIMADIGGSQLVDTDLTFDRSRTRNMAGLISSVGSELIDRRNRTAIVAELDITNRMLEPLLFIDLGANALDSSNVTPFKDPTFKYQIEDGAVETVTLIGEFTNAEILEEIQARVTGLYSVVVRAVMVEGEAPNFIDDLDNDGRFTARDVAAAGYTLLSNQARVRVRISPRELREEQGNSFACPNNLVYADLDGDGLSGGCTAGDGSSRSVRRVPR